MKRGTAYLALAAMLLPALPVQAAEHLVRPAEVREALARSVAGRAADRLVIERILDSPQAASVAAALGTDLERVREALPALSDEELRDLAQRAAALKADPAAGLSRDVNDLLIVFLIVAIVVLVLKAI